jgi:serine phosphatase RsbU (regulator of sigma subunit)
MTIAPTTQRNLRERPTLVPAFTCAEVWGGNRPVQGVVDTPGIRGCVYSQPCAGGRGGDIHYVSICGSGLISRLCLADVVGHGEKVAQVSGEIHDLLRRYMNNTDQRRVLAELNRRLTADELGSLTTAAVATYVHPTRSLSVSYAGHPPAWLYRHEGRAWTRLQLEDDRERRKGLLNLPLSVENTTRFTRRKVRVRNGDRLLLVTDGVLEAPEAGNVQRLYGDERLERLLSENQDADVNALVETVVQAIQAHTRDAGLTHDDVTLLLVEFVPGPRAGGLWLGLKNRVFGRRPRVHGGRA